MRRGLARRNRRFISVQNYAYLFWEVLLFRRLNPVHASITLIRWPVTLRTDRILAGE